MRRPSETTPGHERRVDGLERWHMNPERANRIDRTTSRRRPEVCRRRARRRSFELADGDQFDLRIAPVAKRLGDATVRMLAYNGSIPGPTLRVQQGSELVVNVVNEGDLEATVHWHGLRLENRYDGTPQTQRRCRSAAASPTGSTFPDPGVYWYHPHIREDYGQEMGLYGNIVVVPSEPDYWPPVNRELTLTLDDILLEDGKVAPFSRSRADVHGDGPVRQRLAGERRARAVADRAARRGRALLPDEHRQHARLQRRPARRADEARRRRQRPLRARGVRRERACSRPRSGPWSTCCSTSRAS